MAHITTNGGVRRDAALIILTMGVGDTASTFLASAVLGPGGEANPLMRWALHTDPLAVLGLKLAALIAVIAALYVIHDVDMDHPWTPAWWPTARFAFVLTVAAIGAAVTVTNIALSLAALV